MATDMIINQGDTLTFTIGQLLDGKPIEKGQCDEIELQLGEYDSEGSINLTLSRNEIKWSEALQCYYAKLDQEQTFALPKRVRYQVRVRVDENVGSEKIGTFEIGKTLSRRII